jgi:hypothetical protein
VFRETDRKVYVLFQKPRKSDETPKIGLARGFKEGGWVRGRRKWGEGRFFSPASLQNETETTDLKYQENETKQKLEASSYPAWGARNETKRNETKRNETEPPRAAVSFCLKVFGFVCRPSGGNFVFACPPEGGLGSIWLKHALKQRSPTILIGVARAVVVLVLERAFVVGGEVVAATTRVLAGRKFCFSV